MSQRRSVFSRYFLALAALLGILPIVTESALAQDLPELFPSTGSSIRQLASAASDSSPVADGPALYLPFTADAFQLGDAPTGLNLPCSGEIVMRRTGHLYERYIGGHDIRLSSGTLRCSSNGNSLGMWRAASTLPFEEADITFETPATEITIHVNSGPTALDPISRHPSTSIITTNRVNMHNTDPEEEANDYLNSGGGGGLAIPVTHEICPSGMERPLNPRPLDLLVLYTSSARLKACNNVPGCSNRELALKVSEQIYSLNQLFWDSYILHEVRLTGMIEVPEPEGNSANGTFPGMDLATNRLSGALDQLRNTASGGAYNNALDWVNDSAYPQPLQPARDRFGADLVMLIVSDDDNNPNTCGTGNTFTFPADSTRGYSVVPFDCLRDHFDLQHQIANNIIYNQTDFSGLMHPTPAQRTCFLSDIHRSQLGGEVVGPQSDAILYVEGYRSFPGAVSHIVPSPLDEAHFYAAPGTGYTCDTISNGSALHHQHCIQSAINNSSDGDIILVQPNSDGSDPDTRPDPYYEHLMIGNRNIQLIGDPMLPENVRISSTSYVLPGEGGSIALRIGGHCQTSAGSTLQAQCAPYSGWVQATFTNWPTPTVSGFTFDGGGVTSGSGVVARGVWCIGGSRPNLMNNVIENNNAKTGRGAGVSWESCGGRIENNIIRNNSIVGSSDDFSDVTGAGFIRPNVSDFLPNPNDPSGLYCGTGGDGSYSCWPASSMNSKTYDVAPQSGRTFGYVGGAGIRVSSSRYWEHQYPTSIDYAVTIKNNIIAGNKVATNLFGFATPSDPTPTAVGAGVQLYGLPAKLINNTITGNSSVNTAVTSYVGVLPWTSNAQNLITAWSSASQQAMTGFGIGCVGSGPANSVIVNNVIFRNNASVSGQTTSLVTNYDCPAVSDQRRNLSDPVGLGNEAPDAELTNISLSNIGVASSLSLFTGSTAGDYSLKKCARSGTAGGYRDYGLMSTQHSGVSRFDMMGYLEKRDGNSPYNAFTGPSLKDPGAVEAQATNGVCGGAKVSADKKPAVTVPENG